MRHLRAGLGAGARPDAYSRPMPTESAQLHVDDPELGDLVFDAVVAGADDGEPVLLLHGWPQTTLSWARVIPALASSGLRVAAIDQRGYSAGARPTEGRRTRCGAGLATGAVGSGWKAVSAGSGMGTSAKVSSISIVA